MMRRKMILVTHGFPYGEYERSFLLTELSLLEKQYELSVISVLHDDSNAELLHSVSGNYSYRIYVYTHFKQLIGRLPMDADARHEIAYALSNGSLIRRLKGAKYTVGWLCRSFAFQDALEQIIAQNGCDILYTYWCTEETAAAVRLKKKYPQMKVISRLHGYDLFEERSDFGLQPMHRQIAQYADLLIFVSRNGQQYFQQHFPGQAPLLLSYLGTVGFGRLPRRVQPSFVAVSCSYTVPIKRIPRIADALARVSGIRLHWIHIGDGPDLEWIKAYAEQALFGTDCSVQFTGNLPNEAVAALYRKHQPDLFLTASESEGGTPISIVEAFSCGIPAIGTNVGGIPEIVTDGENGYLVSAQADAQEMADAVMRFYSLPASAQQQMRDNAFQTFESKFDAQVNAGRFLEELLLRFGV